MHQSHILSYSTLEWKAVIVTAEWRPYGEGLANRLPRVGFRETERTQYCKALSGQFPSAEMIQREEIKTQEEKLKELWSLEHKKEENQLSNLIKSFKNNSLGLLLLH